MAKDTAERREHDARLVNNTLVRHQFVCPACQHGVHGACQKKCEYCQARCNCKSCQHIPMAA